MKILLQITVALLILAGLAACTQNDEVIGKRFGQWRITEIEINGEPDVEYQGNMFWCFQAKVIEMQLCSENPYAGTIKVSFGGCTKEGDKLLLDFRNSDAANPEGSPYYSPLPETHLPSMSLITLRIVSAKSKHMVLEYTGENETIIYYLKKWD